MTKLTGLISCLALLMTIAGCGGEAPPTVPAGGTVLMDGKPLDGAGVTLISANGTVALGTTDAAGKFKLKTIIGEKVYDGAVAGSQKVAVSKMSNDGQGIAQQSFTDPKEMAVKMGGAMTGAVKVNFIVAKRYNSPETSGLTCDVPAAGSETLEFKVTAK